MALSLSTTALACSDAAAGNTSGSAAPAEELACPELNAGAGNASGVLVEGT